MTIPDAGVDMQKLPPSYTDGESMKLRPIWKIDNFANIKHTLRPGITHLGIYLRQIEIYVQTKTCSSLFIAVNLETPKMCYIRLTDNHTMVHPYYTMPGMLLCNKKE